MKKIFIIAEAGINHNGNIDIAKKLINAAIYAGANSIKFQKRTIDLVYTKEILDTPRESPWGKITRQQKEGLEFKQEQYEQINDYCKKKNFDWFASCWDLNSLKFIKQFKCKYNKIASAMLTNYSLIEAVAKEKKHTFISTGMHTIKEISKVVKIFRKFKCSFELMHTVSTYPMNDSDANLLMINTLKKIFKCNVGYSGHENGRAVSVAAAALGISSLERHITLDRTMYGSDQAASLETEGFRLMTQYIRIVESALGDGIKKILPEELKIREKLAPIKKELI